MLEELVIMSRIVPPKSAGLPILKRLKFGSKSLKLTIYETIDTISLFIGGHDLYCIEGLIYKPSSVYITDLGYPLNVGRLVQIYYNINCSLEGDFKRGIDTTNILHILCKYLREHYPYVEYLTFTDASYRTCDNGVTIDLAKFSYLRTGMTWYEKNYNAFLEEKYIPLFENMQLSLQRAKNTLTWDRFKQFIHGEYPLDEIKLKELYDKSETWKNFFGSLSDIIGIPQLCIFIAPWLNTFFTSITSTSFSSFTYVLPLHSVPDTVFEVTSYSRGGRRLTRKHVKPSNRNIEIIDTA